MRLLVTRLVPRRGRLLDSIENGLRDRLDQGDAVAAKLDYGDTPRALV